jgi:hypothetical protein
MVLPARQQSSCKNKKIEKLRGENSLEGKNYANFIPIQKLCRNTLKNNKSE